MNKSLLFIICASGVFVFFFCQAILMEKITQGTYGDQINENGEKGEKFTFSLTLVFILCLVNYFFARTILFFKPGHEDKTPSYLYAGSSLTYLLAMVTSTMALQWVSYPTQVVGKSAKPIPVMLLGVLIGGKKYNKIKYFCVFIIVTGIVLFMYKDESNSVNDKRKFGIGEALLIVSLLMDGILGGLQDLIRAYKPANEEDYSSPSGLHMMSAMNGWSTTYIAIALLFSSEGKQFIRFCICYPYVIQQIALLAITGALGQLFIYMIVSGFGPLSCSIVTTTRKFFTVLFSVIFFGNTLNARQWSGAVLVFTGLFFDMLLANIHMCALVNMFKGYNQM